MYYKLDRTIISIHIISFHLLYNRSQILPEPWGYLPNGHGSHSIDHPVSDYSGSFTHKWRRKTLKKGPCQNIYDTTIAKITGSPEKIEITVGKCLKSFIGIQFRGKSRDTSILIYYTILASIEHLIVAISLTLYVRSKRKISPCWL